MKSLDQLISDHADHVAWLDSYAAERGDALTEEERRHIDDARERAAAFARGAAPVLAVREQLRAAGVSVEFDMLWRSREVRG